MAKYKKIFARVGPIVLPLAVAGIRYILKRKRGDKRPGEQGDIASKRGSLDALVDAGLSGLTRTIGGSRRGS